MSKPTPFHKVLIANRGEIAVRILRTARDLGYQTVAVYSRPDAGSAHVLAADQAVCIGGAAPSDSYLRIDRIIEAARATGADAIHPGYGFLAENPALPEACAAAGIVFVGPSAQAIAQMGDKAEAKALMTAAGVPCVPGYQGADQSLKTLRAEAGKIGFPLMIKAVAGGGGRGMRLVTAADQFDDRLAAARSEAKSAFGSDQVLLERAILNPRHIEIQIMADRYGNAIHLGERDCSVQRRHQKLIEEAPSPAVPAALRDKMGRLSTEAAKSIGYEGAGTFEYLLDEAGAFYFMEMNTRLQVEHPVTEAIYGVDLVREQIRVAAGEEMSFKQEDLVIRGHSIEVRINAEKLPNFTPSPGKITTFHAPGGLGVRMDSALYDGYSIPPYYDSLIGKLIVHGPDRPAALARLKRALGEFIVDGIHTTTPLFHALLQEPDILKGDYTIHWLEKWLDANSD